MSKAREFFVETFDKMDKEMSLEQFTNMVLNNLMYLYFEVFNDASSITDAALYEGIDTRNKCIMMLCTASAKGVSLKGFDRIRTHLLDYFETF